MAKGKVAETQRSSTSTESASTSKPMATNLSRGDLQSFKPSGSVREEHGKLPASSSISSSQNRVQAHKGFYIITDEGKRETGAVSTPPQMHPALLNEKIPSQPERERPFERFQSTHPGPPGKGSPRGSRNDNPGDQATLPIVRRVEVLAHQESTGAPENVLQVDVEGGGHRIPRVRVSSPPAWLKYPSTKPGTIEGRLRQVGAQSSPSLSQRHQLEDTGRRSVGTRMQAHFTEEPESEPQSAIPSNTRMSQAKVVQSEMKITPSISMPGSPGFGGSILPGEMALARASEADIATQSTSWKKQHAADLAAAEIRRTVGILSPGTNDERDAAVTEVEAEDSGDRPLDDSSQFEEDDVGIQGLTIVLHLKGKDDLVISTDLTRDAGSSSHTS
ncbi:hypothetical protein B0H63DRAFT_482007 [Podospora didyma]|uniref:Uncharacterized protein n=1 Tax=Podospora didyma TaxID=330526 RepID=A0AAE0KER3_9PEZI|nr:hypothetical protein B0H63DRAFT_482007 [Podospora didyma]